MVLAYTGLKSEAMSYRREEKREEEAKKKQIKGGGRKSALKAPEAGFETQDFLQA
jgi:hypothetical protein